MRTKIVFRWTCAKSGRWVGTIQSLIESDALNFMPSIRFMIDLSFWTEIIYFSLLRISDWTPQMPSHCGNFIWTLYVLCYFFTGLTFVFGNRLLTSDAMVFQIVHRHE